MPLPIWTIRIFGGLLVALAVITIVAAPEPGAAATAALRVAADAAASRPLSPARVALIAVMLTGAVLRWCEERRQRR